MSYFETSLVARGYASNRPYFHPEVIQRVKSRLGLSSRYKRGLDVGCGAGLSTLALVEIAETVIGVDSSQAMIDSAIEHEQIEYFNYPAEDLPIEPVDVITLAGSINWIDRPRFYGEAKRILREDGVIVVYDNTILGVMEENDAFSNWYQGRYLARYPKPPRDERSITEEEAAKYGFGFVDAGPYTNTVRFTLARFIDYIFTQSNVTTALKAHPEGGDGMRGWFESTLAPFFESEERSLRFGGYIWYLRHLRPSSQKG